VVAAERHPETAPGPARRLRRAWASLAPEQRLAAIAALVLWASMFLPWYGKSVTETIKGTLRAASYTLSAFGAFSFVEAAVLLVATSVLVLLFARAERRAFHLPGGDGSVILLAGGWTSLLVFYRMLDKPRTTGNAQLTTTIGLQWGIFVAIGAAIVLAYAGTRLRAARRPEPDRVEDPTLRPPRRPAASAPPAPAAPAAPRAPSRPRPRPRPTGDEPTRAGPPADATTETERHPVDGDPPAEPRRRHRRGPDGIPEFDPFGEP
jgi:hypothetical protein